MNFRGYFLAGLVVVVPPVVTFYVLYVIGDQLDGILGGVFRGEWIRPGGVPGLGLVSLLLIILLVGMLASKTLGRKAVELYERLLARIPILNRVFIGTKQIAEAVFASDTQKFRKVVLIEFPRRGCYVIAFRTERAAEEMCTKAGSDLVSVFLPTTPNPTSGYLLLVPVEEIIELDISVEDGLKMVISAGSVVPERIPREVRQSPPEMSPPKTPTSGAPVPEGAESGEQRS